jgi:hypothetical protein
MITNAHYKKHISALIFAAGLYHAIWYQFYQPDDTFIYLVYVKNFLAGNGATFNGELVEGYSSVLWLAVVSLFSLPGIDLLLGSKIIGWALFAGTAVLLLRMQKEATNDLPSLPYSAALYFSIPIAAMWASGGMETILFSFLITAAAYSYYHARLISQKTSHFVLAGTVFGLLSATRPEGFALIGAIFALELFISFFKKELNLKAVSVTFLTYLSITAFIFGSRFAIYGELFPTTVGAKTGNLSWQIQLGKTYISGFLITYWHLALAYIVATAYLLTKKPQSFWLTLTSLIFVMGYMSFNLLVGGDWMLGYRFIVPILPLIVLPIGVALSYLNRPIAIGLTVILIAYSINLGLQLHEKAIKQVNSDTGDILMGQYIQSLKFPANTKIAVIDAGAIPYYANLPTIDMIGLNDRHISKLPGGFLQKYDNDYVLGQKPEIIQFHTKYVGRSGWVAPTEAFRGSLVLFYTDEFQKWYDRDINAPVPHLFKRRGKPFEITFLDSFYDFKLNGQYDKDSNKLNLDIKKLGDGVWVAQHENRLEAGVVYLQVRVIKSNGQTIYETLKSIPDDMGKGDQESLEVNFPSIKDSTYRILVCPTLLGVKDFPACSSGFSFDQTYSKVPTSLTQGVVSFDDERISLEGWAIPEKGFIWSLGRQAKIHFYISKQKNAHQLKLNLESFKNQRIEIYLNNTLTFSGNLSGSSSIKLSKTVMQGKNELRFVLPDAASPGSDPRLIAVALKSIELE